MDGIEKEVRLLQRLQHKNIVKYIAHFRHRRNLFIVLEFMEGGSLGDLVARGPLDEARAAAVVLQVGGVVCGGLATTQCLLAACPNVPMLCRCQRIHVRPPMYQAYAVLPLD